jgi:hypothetical protein
LQLHTGPIDAAFFMADHASRAAAHQLSPPPPPLPAGPIDAAFSMADHARKAAAKKPPPRWVAAGVSMGLMTYLERQIPSTLKRLYPGNPENADEWLAEEIYRAACDPKCGPGVAGAAAWLSTKCCPPADAAPPPSSLPSRAGDVFASVFYLPPPRALNFLVGEKFAKPTFVLQGALDPLNDAVGRAGQVGGGLWVWGLGLGFRLVGALACGVVGAVRVGWLGLWLVGCLRLGCAVVGAVVCSC